MNTTKTETLARIIKAAKAGNLGARGDSESTGCVYREGHRGCGVGTLLTDEECEKLIEDGMNARGVGSMLEHLGIDPMERWGISRDGMSAIQSSHDCRCEELRAGKVDDFIARLATLDHRGALGSMVSTVGEY